MHFDILLLRLASITCFFHHLLIVFDNLIISYFVFLLCVSFLFSLYVATYTVNKDVYIIIAEL